MLRCPICFLEFAHPLKGPSKNGYEAWYRGETIQMCGGEIYVDYLARLCSPRRRRLRDYHILAMKFLRRVGFNSIPKLLDVGCAEGSFIKAMEEIGLSVYGCDIAEEPIKFAKQEYQLKNVECAPPDNLPGEWKNFDIITCFEVLEHVEQPLQFLKSLYSLLKFGGFLLLSVPHYDVLSNKRKKGGAEWDTPPEHLTRWPHRTLMLALEKIGFLARDIKIFQAGEWETFLDAVLPESYENIYWELWENKARGKKQSLLAVVVELVTRLSLFPFFYLLKGNYARYSFVIARKN